MQRDPANKPKAVVTRTRRKPKGQQQLFAEFALAAYLVHGGDTLSGIAASHGVSLAAVEAANPHLSDPNLIYSGQRIEIPTGSSGSNGSSGSSGSSGSNGSHVPRTYPAQDRDSQNRRVLRGAPAGFNYSSSSLSDIPGVPQSFAACVALRESTDLENPAAHGNAYGIIPASGYQVAGTSLAHQKQVFTELYQQYGGTPWAADGCPGT